jgi:hypothetical protein
VLVAAVPDAAQRLKDARLALIMGDAALREQLRGVLSPRVHTAASAGAATAAVGALALPGPTGLLGVGTDAVAIVDPDDLRTLWIDHNAQRQRFKPFTDAVNESTQERFKDSPEAGSGTALATCAVMSKNGGDPELWLLNFAREKGLAKHDRNWHELSAWCRMLRHAGVFDQLNLGSCVCLETACRRISAIAKALETGRWLRIFKASPTRTICSAWSAEERPTGPRVKRWNWRPCVFGSQEVRAVQPLRSAP